MGGGGGGVIIFLSLPPYNSNFRYFKRKSLVPRTLNLRYATVLCLHTVFACQYSILQVMKLNFGLMGLLKKEWDSSNCHMVKQRGDEYQNTLTSLLHVYVYPFL